MAPAPAACVQSLVSLGTVQTYGPSLTTGAYLVEMAAAGDHCPGLGAE